MTDTLEYELTLGQHKYRITRMSVYEQMQVSCDYRDILVALAMLKKERPPEMDDASFQNTVNFIITSRAGNEPQVRARVWDTCFRKIQRGAQTGAGQGWSPILATAGMLQFDDIQPPQFIALLYASFEHNRLLDFFSESQSGSEAPKA